MVEKWYEKRQRLKSEGRYESYIRSSGSNHAQFKLKDKEIQAEPKVTPIKEKDYVHVGKGSSLTLHGIKDNRKPEKEEKISDGTPSKTTKVKKETKEKPSKFLSKLGKSLSKPLSNRSVIKSQKQITIKIPERKVENIFEDENRFFKGNFEKEKRSMFLS